MIFELMMLRFDILQLHRKQIIHIYNSIKKRPKDIIMILPAFIESMIMMAKISNISIQGIKGNLKIKGLLIILVIYLKSGNHNHDFQLRK